MRCPDCDATLNRVVDTRETRAGRAIRRRRECKILWRCVWDWMSSPAPRAMMYGGVGGWGAALYSLTDILGLFTTNPLTLLLLKREGEWEI